MNKDLVTPILTKYSDVAEEKISWLWKPYIPYGKITTVQGDPGEGKSTMILNIAAKLSSGGAMPFSRKNLPVQNVIYQCSEDGINDTIKPRLIKAKADCNHIAFINEDKYPLVLGSEVLEQAIADFEAKLVVIDPIQSYIGDADMTCTGGMRRILHRLSLCAAAHKCAIVLVGHLNKKENSKNIYRGLGSIDIVAAARSVLQIEHSKENVEEKRISQIKNSLTKKGDDCLFKILSNGEISWIKSEASEKNEIDENIIKTKQETALLILQNILSSEPIDINEIFARTTQGGISRRTVYAVKKLLPIKITRKNGHSYWSLISDNPMGGKS